MCENVKYGQNQNSSNSPFVLLKLLFKVLRKLSFLQLIDVLDDGTISVMDDNGDTREDLNLPPGDLGKDIKDRFEKGENISVSWNFFLSQIETLL